MSCLTLLNILLWSEYCSTIFCTAVIVSTAVGIPSLGIPNFLHVLLEELVLGDTSEYSGVKGHELGVVLEDNRKIPRDEKGC